MTSLFHLSTFPPLLSLIKLLGKETEDTVTHLFYIVCFFFLFLRESVPVFKLLLCIQLFFCCWFHFFVTFCKTVSQYLLQISAFTHSSVVSFPFSILNFPLIHVQICKMFKDMVKIIRTISILLLFLISFLRPSPKKPFLEIS